MLKNLPTYTIFFKIPSLSRQSSIEDSFEMAWSKLKKAGEARRDYKTTFIKQLIFWELVKPLFSLSNKYMENEICSVSFSCTGSLSLGFALTEMISFTIIFLASG